MASKEVQNDGQMTISISEKWTWINFSLSVFGSVSGFLAYHICLWNKNELTYYVQNFDYVVSFLAFFVAEAFCLALLLYSEKLCSSCCKNNLPILYKTGVDVNNFTKTIDLQTGQEYGKNEDEEMNEIEKEAKTHQLESIASSVCETNSETISNNEAAN